jgi:Tfp pilus assembly protein PilF
MENAVALGKPTLRIEEKFTEPVERIFVSRIGAILEKDLTPAFCNNAEAALQADAWALGAMVDVGLCTAARGDLEEADAVLARLLEFTPDNYEALVGRAIIAEQANEKGVARKYYQDALNALPPLAESNRIENAMAALE